MWKKLLEKLYFRKVRSLVVSFLKPGIFNKHVGKVIIDHYDGRWQEVERETGGLGFGFFHYALIVSLKPKRVLCIGSQQGFIPLICALACKNNKSGCVDFVDAGYGKGHSRAWSGIGFWKKNNPTKHFAFLAGKGWIKTYVMTAEEFSKRFPKRKYSYIHIDGDHSYKGVKGNFEDFWPRLEKGGFMSFHDIFPKGSFRGKYKFGVWKLWEELATTHKSFYLPGRSGLGVIQKDN